MIPESLLTELRNQATAARKRKPAKWVDIDPRTLLDLLDEVERFRLVNLIEERRALDPSHKV